jgi:hypothetical protein
VKRDGKQDGNYKPLTALGLGKIDEKRTFSAD